MGYSVNRLKESIDRVNWLGELMNGRMHALKYMAALKFNPHRKGAASYRNLSLQFRKDDLSALREVLISAEYTPIETPIRTTEKPVIIDVGAHIGLFALWAFSLNKQAHILSLEADPDTFALLEENKKANDSILNWKALNHAAWSREEDLAFSTDGEAMGHHIDTHGQITVKGMPLKDIVSPYDKIDIMKVDIEGAEEEFICSAPEYLAPVNLLIIELHRKHCDTERVRQTLHDAFPIVEELQGRRNSKPVLLCRRSL
jgi:FkbM family methyltransferase